MPTLRKSGVHKYIFSPNKAQGASKEVLFKQVVSKTGPLNKCSHLNASSGGVVSFKLKVACGKKNKELGTKGITYIYKCILKSLAEQRSFCIEILLFTMPLSDFESHISQ
jgi:hypothetical protein